jgi:spermidine synthase
MAELFGDCLSDRRVDPHEGDVADLIRAGDAAYDAILLDVDNGPKGLTRKANDDLYDAPGLERARRALRPGGVLAVWSSEPDPPFTKRLIKAGFDAREVPVRARSGRRGARHLIWMAETPAG